MVNYTPKFAKLATEFEIQSSQSAKDIMLGAYAALTPEMGMDQAITVLLRNKADGAPVVDNSGRLVGFLSQIECLRYEMDIKYHNHHKGDSVGDYMVMDPVVIGPDEKLVTVISTLIKTGFLIYPVVDQGFVIGIIRRDNILEEIGKLAQTTWDDVA